MYLRVDFFPFNRNGNRVTLKLASDLTDLEIKQKVLSICSIYFCEKESDMFSDHIKSGLAQKLLDLDLSNQDKINKWNPEATVKTQFEIF